jgi:hypothetical protein
VVYHVGIGKLPHCAVDVVRRLLHHFRTLLLSFLGQPPSLRLQVLASVKLYSNKILQLSLHSHPKIKFKKNLKNYSTVPFSSAEQMEGSQRVVNYYFFQLTL